MSDTTQRFPGPAHTGQVSDEAACPEYAHYRIVPAKHHARTAGTVLAIVLIGIVLNSILGNPRWGWGVFIQWFFAGPVLEGLGRTLVLTGLGALFGAGHAVSTGARIAFAATGRLCLGVHLAVPFDSAHRVAASAEQPRLSVRDDLDWCAVYAYRTTQ
jgi:hypothetical protein